MKNAKASLEIEGLKEKKEYEELVRRKLSAEISLEYFLEQAQKLAKKTSSNE